ncbi:MAG: PKD domain-containing protein, partial [Planctomycetota bacterium]
MKTKLLAAVLIAGILFILADKVYACGQPPMPPVADLTAYPALALVGEEVLLDGSESYDPDGFIILYQWDWEDDGEYDYSQPHTGDGKATHAYTDANLYTVRLRVVDNDLSDANTTCDVNVVRVKNITQGTGYNAIGPAIDDANDDDIIEVSKYTYESINFNGKKIHLRSTDPNDPCVVDGTVIDGSTSTDAVAFGQDGNSVLEGFTIRGGTRSRVYCYKSSPKISNCKIVNSTKNGTGIYC